MNTKLLFICLVFALPVHGQNTQPLKDSATSHKCCNAKHRISFGGTIGCGMPTEGYGLTSPNSNTYFKGYADPGVCFNLNLNFRITKHFGLMLESGGTINTLDKKFYNDPRDGIIGGTGGTYYIATILAGPFYTLSFKNGNIFETRLLMGSIALNKSSILLANDDAYQPSMASTIPGFSSQGFCTELGAKFKLHITHHLYITTNIAYTQSIAYNMYYNYNIMITTIGPSEPLRGPLAILSTSLGAEFKL